MEKHTLPIRSEQNSISFLDNKSREGKKKKKIRNAIDFARFASTKYTTATLSRSRGALKEGWKPTPQRPVDTLLIYDLLRDSYVHTRVYRPFLTETDKQGWENHRARLLDPFFYTSLIVLILLLLYASIIIIPSN